MYSVYQVTRVETGDHYVGITNRPAARWKEHKSVAARGSRLHLHNAIRKYGADAFDYQVIAELPTPQEAQIAERILIALETPRYNTTAGGEGAPGLKHSEQARARMSRARVGNQYNLGKRASAETRARMSAASKGVPKTPEHRAKIGAAHVGMKRSPEARARMSAAQKASFARRKGGLVQSPV